MLKVLLIKKEVITFTVVNQDISFYLLNGKEISEIMPNMRALNKKNVYATLFIVPKDTSKC